MNFRNTSESSNSQNASREATIVEGIDIVNKIARGLIRRLPPCVTLDDLTGAGMIGLIQAADRFDPARKLKFTTYAQHRIRGAMQDFLRNLDPLSRTERGRIREHFGTPGRAVTVSLDLVLHASAAQPDIALRSEMQEARRCLSARENLVIRLLYDLGWQSHEIAAELRIHQSRVSQIKRAALTKLRRHMEPVSPRRAA